MDTEKLLHQAERDEQDVTFPRFSAADAWELGALMVRRAQEQKMALAISIDMNGQKLFYYALSIITRGETGRTKGNINDPAHASRPQWTQLVYGITL